MTGDYIRVEGKEDPASIVTKGKRRECIEKRREKEKKSRNKQLQIQTKRVSGTA